ncbi:MAG: drug/metabolite transporter (DMT)-like permease [Gammaproteobacteria bacterium]
MVACARVYAASRFNTHRPLTRRRSEAINLSDATSARTAGTEYRGLLLALLVACAFAVNSAFARLAYEAGSNALTVLTVRTLTALLVLTLLLRVVGVSATLPRKRAFGALALGLLMASYSYGLLGSIQYVPLAVGLVTFYTYPLLTALISAALGRERLQPLTLVALVVAFCGLALVLDLGGNLTDPVGIAHALGASVCFTALLLLSDTVRGGGDSRPITLHMLVTTLLVYVLACAVTGAFTLPTTTLGWIGLLGCPVLYSFAIITLFEAVSAAGPVRAALMLNLEPVFSASLGYALLDQLLNGWQVVGMALVVGAVVSARLPAVLGSRWHALDRIAAFALISGLILVLAALSVLP